MHGVTLQRHFIRKFVRYYLITVKEISIMQYQHVDAGILFSLYHTKMKPQKKTYLNQENAHFQNNKIFSLSLRVTKRADGTVEEISSKDEGMVQRITVDRINWIQNRSKIHAHASGGNANRLSDFI